MIKNKNFIPLKGCVNKCPILLKEKELNSEICCCNSRQCCFTCLNETCPIKNKYKNIIKKYNI